LQPTGLFSIAERADEEDDDDGDDIELRNLASERAPPYATDTLSTTAEDGEEDHQVNAERLATVSRRQSRMALSSFSS
jgi:hypothetical protein